jgi:hypothetical protein
MAFDLAAWQQFPKERPHLGKRGGVDAIEVHARVHAASASANIGKT